MAWSIVANRWCYKTLTYSDVLLQQAQARAAIEALQAHPDAWGRVDVILQHSKSPQSKFVALQVIVLVMRCFPLPDQPRLPPSLRLLADIVQLCHWLCRLQNYLWGLCVFTR